MPKGQDSYRKSNASRKPKTKVCEIAKLEQYSGCGLGGAMSDAPVASERLPDDRGVFDKAGKSVWRFLLFAWSAQRSADGCVGFRFGSGSFLRLDRPAIRDAVRQGLDTGDLTIKSVSPGCSKPKEKRDCFHHANIDQKRVRANLFRGRYRFDDCPSGYGQSPHWS